MEKQNVFTSAKPFLTLAKLLGFFPMSFHGPAHKGNFKIKCFNILASSCLALTLILIMVLIIKNNAFVALESNILFYGWAISLFFEIISQIVLFLYQVCRRKDVVGFLKTLNECDEQVIFLFNLEVTNWLIINSRLEVFGLLYHTSETKLSQSSF
jgi:7tm Chemosensory receptor